jgi:hypothetical protein
MSTSSRTTRATVAPPITEARATGVRFDDDTLVVALLDGRELTVPLAWYPRLAAATADQRRDWQLVGRGVGIHWPDIDEDLSVAGMLGDHD